MLEIKVNLIPYGDRSLERTIESLIIYNDGTGRADYGNYVVKYKGKEVATVKNHYRPLGSLELLRRALNEYLL